MNSVWEIVQKESSHMLQKFSEIVVREALVEMERREAILQDFLVSGAFFNDLSTVEVRGEPATWRVR